MEDSSVSFRSCAYILTVHVCLACSWEAHVVVRYYSQLRVKNLVNRMAFNSISITAIFLFMFYWSGFSFLDITATLLFIPLVWCSI